jgi:hypothetical protein
MTGCGMAALNVYVSCSCPYVELTKRNLSMLQEGQLVAIFCEIDDFCKELDKNISQPQQTPP